MVLIRSRAFIFVLFISKQEEEAWLPIVKADLESYPTRFCRLLISGAELCPTTQRRHVHVYVEFEYQKQASQLDRLLRLTGLPKPYIQAATKGDYSRIRTDYVKTTTKEDPDVLINIEWPALLDTNDEDTDCDRPMKRTKLSDHELRQLVETGNVEEIKNRDYRFYLRQKSSIEAEAGRHRPKTLDIQHEHLWIVGYTGSYKTSFCKFLYPDAYQWDLCNPNPEEYNKEDVVIMDDMDNKRMRLLTVGKLKNLCNPMGTRCKVNYGAVYVKSRIIVTSQYTLKECFKHKGKAKFIPNPDFNIPEDKVEDDPDYQALNRRFREVTIDQYLAEHKKTRLSKDKIKQLTLEEKSRCEFFVDTDEAYTESNYDPNGVYGSESSKEPRSDVSSSIVGNCHGCDLPGIKTAEGVHIHRKRQASEMDVTLSSTYKPNFVMPPCTNIHCGKNGLFMDGIHTHYTT